MKLRPSSAGARIGVLSIAGSMSDVHVPVLRLPGMWLRTEVDAPTVWPPARPTSGTTASSLIHPLASWHAPTSGMYLGW